MSAAIRVFDTIELLEAILLQLPPRSLLTSQRVSTTFNSTIEASHKLQRALFLRPSSSTSIEPHEGPACSDLNKLVLRPTKASISDADFDLRRIYQDIEYRSRYTDEEGDHPARL